VLGRDASGAPRDDVVPERILKAWPPGSRRVRWPDGLVRYRFGDNAELMARGFGTIGVARITEGLRRGSGVIP